MKPIQRYTELQLLKSMIVNEIWDSTTGISAIRAELRMSNYSLPLHAYNSGTVIAQDALKRKLVIMYSM